MTTVTISPLEHKGIQVIGIYLEKDIKLNSVLQKEVAAKWSNTKKCWYMPCTKDACNKLAAALKGIATLEGKAMRAFFVETHDNASYSPKAERLNKTDDHPSLRVQPIGKPIIKYVPPPIRLCDANAEALIKFNQKLTLKAYSPNTIRTYAGEFSIFLQTLGNTTAEDLTTERVKDYLFYCHKTLQLSENTIHSRMNALKFFYEQVLSREKFFWEIPRPKKPFLLPNFFNQDEIVAILKGTVNIKHKTMLMLAYSSGLRVSEVVAMKTYNIDSKRMCMKIEQGKGKKDRMVGLSPVLLVMMREYCRQYKPKKEGYLFMGEIEGMPYSPRSLQKVLTSAKQRAGILKPGSIHALRHSFATHLVDRGTDVTIIQKIMGHNDIKTTMRYLHTSNKDLLKILSPLDTLNLD
jgi:site-specific recombinase XerD